MPAQSANSRDHGDPLIHFVDFCIHLSLLVVILSLLSINSQIVDKRKLARSSQQVATAQIRLVDGSVPLTTVKGEADSDGDGWADTSENYLGTDPTKACGPRAWPPDFDNSQKVDDADVAILRPHFFEKVNTNNRRFNLVNDDIIDLRDVISISPYYGKTCTISLAPTLSFTINNLTAPPTIAMGTSITLVWRAAYAIACDANGDWTGQLQTSGQQTKVLTQAKTYTFNLTCYGGGGKITKSVSVTAQASTSILDTIQISFGNGVDPPPQGTVGKTYVNYPVSVYSQALKRWLSSSETSLSISSGSLPSGLVLNDALDFIGGTPTAIGRYAFSIKAVSKLTSALATKSTSITVVNLQSPPPPTGLSASCSSSNALTFSWSASAGATTYAVRVDDLANGWGGYSVSPGDTLSDNNPATSYLRPGEAGHTYKWWVHAINSAGWSTEAFGPNVSCALPPPPPACSGTPALTLSPQSVQTGQSATATGWGVSNCTSNDSFHFFYSSDGVNWQPYAPYCNINPATQSCSNAGRGDLSVGTYSVIAKLNNAVASASVSLTVTSGVPPVIGDPGKDAIREYIKSYVGGWNVRRTIGGYDLNFGRFLWGLAGCESRWDPLDNTGDNGTAFGLFQYHLSTWTSTVNEARERGANVGDDIFNYQHQVQVTVWKVSPNGGGDYPQAWSCWNNWFTGARNWTWFTDEWPDPNF